MRVAKTLEPGAVIASVRPMEDVVNSAMQSRRLASSLVGAFAVIALLLASGGLYGVMAASVIERSREMGLRSALGASRASVIRLVVSRGFLMTMAGIAIGGAGVVAARGLLRQFVFGVTPADPVTLGAVALLLTAVAIVACLVPAWRAAHVDPAIALRE